MTNVPVYKTKANNKAKNSGDNSKPPDCVNVPNSFWEIDGIFQLKGIPVPNKPTKEITKNIIKDTELECISDQ